MDHVWPSRPALLRCHYSPAYLLPSHSEYCTRYRGFLENRARHLDLGPHSGVDDEYYNERKRQLGFWHLPVIMGFDRQRLLQGDFSERSPAETIMLLTDWLFFGMLEEITGLFVHHDRYIISDGLRLSRPVSHHRLDSNRDRRSDTAPSGGEDASIHESSGIFLSTKEITGTLLEWWHRCNEFGSRPYDETSRMNGCILNAWHLLTQHAKAFSGLYTPFSGETHFACVILGEMLQELKRDLWLNHMPISNGVTVSRSRRGNFGDDVVGRVLWGPTPLLSSMMEKARWCPADIRRLETTMPVTVGHCILQACGAEPPDRHKLCNQHTCIVNNVVPGSYQFRHAEQNHLDPCVFLGPNMGEIRKIIKEGHIPVIELTQDPKSREVSMKVARSHNYDFVAISHVWSDGLGNPTQNTLPACQLIRLYDLLLPMFRYYDDMEHSTGVQKLYRSVANGFKAIFRKSVVLWIDTICIPVGDDAESKAMRQIAIGKLGETYGTAYKVLVLDRALEGTNLPSKLTDEAIGRLYASGWMKRMWTFQEMILSDSSLYVQYSDGQLHLWREMVTTSPEHKHNDVIQTSITTSRPVDPWTWTEMYGANFIDYVEKPYEYHLRRYWSALYNIQNMQGAEKLAAIWNEARFREPTKPEDLPIILAILLGLPTKPLLDIKNKNGTKDDMMVALFRRLERVPVDILFLTSRRPRTDHAAWIPLDLSTSETIDVEPNGIGNVTDQGLCVSLPGGELIHGAEGINTHRGCFLAIHGRQMYNVKLETSTERAAQKGRMPMAVRAGEKLAIVYGIGQLLKLKGFASESKNGSRRGILVRTRGTEEPEPENVQPLKVNYICQVRITVVSDSDALTARLRESVVVVAGDDGEMREWCIG